MTICRSPLPHFRQLTSVIENVFGRFPFLSCVNIQWCFLGLIYVSYTFHFIHIYWRNNCRHTNHFRIFKFPVSFHTLISVHEVTDYAESFRLRYLTWQVLNSVSFIDHNQINFLRYWKPLQRWWKLNLILSVYSPQSSWSIHKCSTSYTWLESVFQN
jgi:hypothetical protein